MEYLAELNQEQLRAVNSQEPYLRVIAGAGSGKTKVLTHRIAYLVNDLGIPDYSILAITFTNKAAKEMKQRVLALLGHAVSGATICTFHSFCARLLREDISIIGYPRAFIILDEDDQKRIIKDLVEINNIECEEITVKDYLTYISGYKSEGVTVEEAEDYADNLPGETLKAQVYRYYEEYLAKNFYLDFDDLLLKAVEILTKYPNIHRKWQSRITNILVDEFQDTNSIQYQLIKLLTNESTNLFVVGDPDQTIYTWRGADVGIIMNFKKDYQGVVDVVLTTNYRSTPSILNCANALIAHNKDRVPKDLLTNNADGGKVLYFQGDSPGHEASWVVDRIQELMKKNSANNYGDFAILYRSNYYSRAFESALIRAHIPYAIYGGKKFFERKEVKDAICYLRLAVRSDDNLAFERVINEPRRGIGNKAMSQIINEANSLNVSYYDGFNQSQSKSRKSISIEHFFNAVEKARLVLNDKNTPYAEVLQNLLEESQYIQSLIDSKDKDRLDNINELKNFLFELQKESPERDIVDVLQEMALYAAQDEMREGKRVSLLTIHTAKGLEFKYVFLVGMSEGILPNARAVLDNPKAIEEERRLAYVAFTRAKKQLFLSDANGYNFSAASFQHSSRFLEEAGNYISPYFNSPRYQYSLKRPKPPKRTLTAIMPNNISWHPGDMLRHTVFGEGIVIKMDAEALTVAFKESKYGQKVIKKNFGGICKI